MVCYVIYMSILCLISGYDILNIWKCDNIELKLSPTPSVNKCHKEGECIPKLPNCSTNVKHNDLAQFSMSNCYVKDK